ncbi:FAD-dependent oxidoreductase [Dactylosporangium sp. CS-033363]|uniref:FAD-dependent oxidoreductase n=1 Tax=Dactylosporangium sp. CS-033363 TaxID=3239935 RepID=UPI003D92F35D
MDIIIAGAGIGGLALAHGLLADGHAVRVLEAADGPRRGGAAVTIYSNGAAALDGLGVPLPEGLGARIDALEIRDDKGRRVSRMDLTVLRKATGFPVTTVVRERLIAHLAKGIPVEYGQKVESATPDGTVVVGGRTLQADVVVGADGAHSRVRNGDPAAWNGWTTFQGLSTVPAKDGLLIVGEAGLVGLMPAGDGLAQWWFDVRGDVFDPAAFAGYADPVPEVLANLTGLGSFPHLLHEPAWGAGKVALIGDAAHVFPPSQAQGANQALEDAWTLRRTLAGDGDLRAYGRLRTPPVRLVSQMAASERTNRPAGPITKALARMVPAGLAGRGYVALVRRFSTVLR